MDEKTHYTGTLNLADALISGIPLSGSGALTGTTINRPPWETVPWGPEHYRAERERESTIRLADEIQRIADEKSMWAKVDRHSTIVMVIDEAERIMATLDGPVCPTEAARTLGEALLKLARAIEKEER